MLSWDAHEQSSAVKVACCSRLGPVAEHTASSWCKWRQLMRKALCISDCRAYGSSARIARLGWCFASDIILERCELKITSGGKTSSAGLGCERQVSHKTKRLRIGYHETFEAHALQCCPCRDSRRCKKQDEGRACVEQASTYDDVSEHRPERHP